MGMNRSEPSQEKTGFWRYFQELPRGIRILLWSFGLIVALQLLKVIVLICLHLLGKELPPFM